ncbi:MAG TPA: response regulator [Blastocatellia bacterium]|nr:response regulator [Blastocatellia bacterium]
MSTRQSFVLCVEDDPDTQEMLRIFIQERGCHFTAVDNCEDALRLIKETELSLVLMDNLLPDGNGIELCRTVRKFDKDLPVVFLSGSGHDERDRAMEVGANAFLTKPFALDELFAVLSDYIRLSELQLENSPASLSPNFNAS